MWRLKSPRVGSAAGLFSTVLLVLLICARNLTPPVASPLHYSSYRASELCVVTYSTSCSRLLSPSTNMLSQELPSTHPLCASQSTAAHPSSEGSLHQLYQLPSSLVDLILCFLPLHDKLSHCSHLSRRAPPLSPASLRYDELQLTAASTARLLHSSRLLALLSQLSHLSCVFDEWLVLPKYVHGIVVPFGLSEVSLPLVLRQLPSHFPALARLTIRCPTYDMQRTEQVPLPKLQSSLKSTLRSLAFESISLDTSSQWLLSNVLSLSALRNLCLAVTLHPDCLSLLLQQPLHILDLSDSRLSKDAAPFLPERGWVLATTCRVLKLPTSRFLTSDFYLDSILQRWQTEVAATGRQLHTLEINHVMSESAVHAAFALPAPHNLSVAVQGHKADLDSFLPTAASLPALNSPKVHLRVYAHHWRREESLQHCLDLLTRHPTHIRTLDVTVRPQPMGEIWLAQKLLAALSHCSRLQSVVLHCGDTNAPVISRNAHNGQVNEQWRSLPALWARDIRLPDLRILSVTNVADADLCRIVASCPALEYCMVDLLPASVSLLSLLAITCPMLKTLHVRSRLGLAHSLDDEKSELQRQFELVPFRSLTSLTLPGVAGWLGRKAAVAFQTSTLQALLAGSPLRRLQLADWYTNESHVNALLPVLQSLPQLEVLLLREGSGAVEPPPTARWDEEGQVEEEEQASLTRHSHISSASPPPSDALHSTFASPSFDDTVHRGLHHLALLLQALQTVHPTLSPMSNLATLLSHTPHLTSITVTIRANQSLAATCVLHTLGVLGMYAPLIETIIFIHDLMATAPVHHSVSDVLDTASVRSLADCYTLPACAFGRLRRVLQKKVRRLASSEVRFTSMIDAEALDWLHDHWLKSVPLDRRDELGQWTDSSWWD